MPRRLQERKALLEPRSLRARSKLAKSARGIRWALFFLSSDSHSPHAARIFLQAECSATLVNINVRVEVVEYYSRSPFHDQCGMLRPFGTSSADRW